MFDIGDKKTLINSPFYSRVWSIPPKNGFYGPRKDPGQYKFHSMLDMG